MASEKFTLRIDPDALTIGDLEDFEDGVGKPLHDALKPSRVYDEEGKPVIDPETGRPMTEVKVSGKALSHLVWITKRAEDASFTLADARKVKVSQLEVLGEVEDSAGNADASSDKNDA